MDRLGNITVAMALTVLRDVVDEFDHKGEISLGTIERCKDLLDKVKRQKVRKETAT